MPTDYKHKDKEKNNFKPINVSHGNIGETQIQMLVEIRNLLIDIREKLNG